MEIATACKRRAGRGAAAAHPIHDTHAFAPGALRRDLEVIDVTATCEAAVEHIRPWAESKQTEIQLKSNGKVLFRADPEDLQLVWTNLLENAVRYSPKGGSVEVGVSSNNGG